VDVRRIRIDLLRLHLLTGRRSGGAPTALGGASTAAYLAAPATVPCHHRRRREVGMLDLHAAWSIDRRQGDDLTSAGGGGADGVWLPSASPTAIYAGFSVVWVRPGSVFQARPPIRGLIWPKKGPKLQY
jgi:hypothetical protein